MKTKPIPVRKINTAFSELSAAGRLSLRRVSDLLNGADLQHGLHRHDFFLVLLIEQGEGIHEIDFNVHQLGRHSLFVLRPGQVHSLSIKAGGTGYLLEFDPAFYRARTSAAEKRWKQASRTSCCRLTPTRFERINSVFATMHAELQTRQEGYTDALAACLELFFIEYSRQGRSDAPSGSARDNYIQERFDEITALMESNITRLRSPSDYAALLNLSLYQLNAVSRAAVGKTASELIHDLILLEAKRQLLGTQHQVKEIAAALGYEDVSYFIRFFKKHTGYSPDAFREKSK